MVLNLCFTGLKLPPSVWSATQYGHTVLNVVSVLTFNLQTLELIACDTMILQIKFKSFKLIFIFLSKSYIL